MQGNVATIPASQTSLTLAMLTADTPALQISCPAVIGGVARVLPAAAPHDSMDTMSVATPSGGLLFLDIKADRGTAPAVSHNADSIASSIASVFKAVTEAEVC